ncbi:MAG: DUF1844 domain-containing protein [Candidatus Omnitrophica bacterium]|nr:DUF1844 domain-containing protein [Candidatus Omnitrophota bacterium]
MEHEKHVDESWKETVENEKTEGQQPSVSAETQTQEDQLGKPGMMEVTFVNYVTSLVLQAMIFLGEMPNPLTSKVEKNLDQAKFLIDTLILIREKTKGNLSKEEEDILNHSLYELQMKYIEFSRSPVIEEGKAS